MVLPQGSTIEEEKQAAGHSVANHTTLLEGTKWFLAVLEKHSHALSNLAHQQEQIDDHFSLSERQVYWVDKETLEKVEEHWIGTNESQTEDQHAEVDKGWNEGYATEACRTFMALRYPFRFAWIEEKEATLKFITHLFQKIFNYY